MNLYYNQTILDSCPMIGQAHVLTILTLLHINIIIDIDRRGEHFDEEQLLTHTFLNT